MTVSVEAKRISTRAQLEGALDAIVDQAGGEVALAAMNLTTGEDVARNAERSMPTASVFKLPLLVEVFRQAEEGALDLDEIVLSGPTELLDGALATAALETIRTRTMGEFTGSLTLRMTTQGQDIVLRGAAVMVLSGQLGVS